MDVVLARAHAHTHTLILVDSCLSLFLPWWPVRPSVVVCVPLLRACCLSCLPSLSVQLSTHASLLLFLPLSPPPPLVIEPTNQPVKATTAVGNPARRLTRLKSNYREEKRRAKNWPVYVCVTAVKKNVGDGVTSHTLVIMETPRHLKKKEKKTKKKKGKKNSFQPFDKQLEERVVPLYLPLCTITVLLYMYNYCWRKTHASLFFDTSTHTLSFTTRHLLAHLLPFGVHEISLA